MTFKPGKYKLALNFSEIVKGSDIALKARVSLVDGCDDSPVELTSLVGATAYFAPADDSAEDVAVTGTLSSGPLGEVSFPIAAAQSDTMLGGDLQDIEVEFQLAAGTLVVQLEEGLTIRERLFAP